MLNVGLGDGDEGKARGGFEDRRTRAQQDIISRDFKTIERPDLPQSHHAKEDQQTEQETG